MANATPGLNKYEDEEHTAGEKGVLVLQRPESGVCSCRTERVQHTRTAQEKWQSQAAKGGLGLC